jgi:hypothetical protein
VRTLHWNKPVVHYVLFCKTLCRTAAANGPFVHPPDDTQVWSSGGMILTGNNNRSTARQTAPVPLCPPQIPHGQTWRRIRASTARSRWLSNRLSYGTTFARVNKANPKLRNFAAYVNRIANYYFYTLGQRSLSNEWSFTPIGDPVLSHLKRPNKILYTHNDVKSE